MKENPEIEKELEEILSEQRELYAEEIISIRNSSREEIVLKPPQNILDMFHNLIMRVETFEKGTIELGASLEKRIEKLEELLNINNTKGKNNHV